MTDTDAPPASLHRMYYPDLRQHIMVNGVHWCHEPGGLWRRMVEAEVRAAMDAFLRDLTGIVMVKNAPRSELRETFAALEDGAFLDAGVPNG